MMRRTIALVSLALVLILGLTAPAADPGRRETPNGPAAQGYPSPREAYEAYRQALDKDDWRTAFYCFTPAAGDDQVFGTFDGATFRAEEPKVAAAMKKYGLGVETVMKEYTKQYRDKHGVDLEKLQAEIARRRQERLKKYIEDHPEARVVTDDYEAVTVPAEAEPKLSMPPFDHELLREIVLRFVTDKAGFYAEVNGATIPAKKNDTLRSTLGPLERVTITGDRATGWITVTNYHLAFAADGIERKEPDPPRPQRMRFRRLNGRWFLGP
jgi:hypothetical protein